MFLKNLTQIFLNCNFNDGLAKPGVTILIIITPPPPKKKNK